MTQQTQAAIAGADACLFVIDARAGVTAGDEVIAQALRKSGKPVILVANKCESHAGDTGYGEAFSLGFGEPVAISAEHSAGFRRAGGSAAGAHRAAVGRRGGRRRARRRRRRPAGSSHPPRHRRPPECRQVEPVQSPARRGALADRPRSRHHARRGGRGLDVRRPRIPAPRHRGPAQEGARRRPHAGGNVRRQAPLEAIRSPIASCW